jgi:trehalose synthase (ADP-glucose) (EC 2.4.1.-)
MTLREKPFTKSFLNLTAEEKDVFVLNLPPDSHREVNAFQRGATVVIQKSIREGFWTCGFRSHVERKSQLLEQTLGGIRRQIVHGITGFLVESVEGAALRIKQLLSSDSLRKDMGYHAKERVKHRYLITRHLRDYLLIIHKILSAS